MNFNKKEVSLYSSKDYKTLKKILGRFISQDLLENSSLLREEMNGKEQKPFSFQEISEGRHEAPRLWTLKNKPRENLKERNILNEQ